MIERQRTITCMFDGSCLHGVDGAGAAVALDAGGRVIARRARYIPEPTTTNVAEYRGLILALELAGALRATDVVILGDSELVVRQFDGSYACRKQHLRGLLSEARGEADRLRSSGAVVSVSVLPKAGPKGRRRWGNGEADELASRCRKTRSDIG